MVSSESELQGQERGTLRRVGFVRWRRYWSTSNSAVSRHRLRYPVITIQRYSCAVRGNIPKSCKGDRHAIDRIHMVVNPCEIAGFKFSQVPQMLLYSSVAYCSFAGSPVISTIQPWWCITVLHSSVSPCLSARFSSTQAAGPAQQVQDLLDNSDAHTSALPRSATVLAPALGDPAPGETCSMESTTPAS
jgi:hypothetical protein